MGPGAFQQRVYRERHKVSSGVCHTPHSTRAERATNQRKPLIYKDLKALAQPLLYAFQLPNKHNSQETHHALRTSRYRRREGFLQEPLR